MYALTSQYLQGSLIASNSGKIGDIDFLIFDHRSLKLLAIVLKKPLWQLFQASRYIPSDAIIALEAGNAYVESIQKLKQINKNKELVSLLKQPPLIGKRVVSESGQSLGNVQDILFDTENLIAQKLYLSSLFKQRIIAVEKIIRIDRQFILISDIVESDAIKEVA